ncbi:c-type cytochrome [Thiopseudomonas denitrificans]|uniref:Cytochrome c553 n=1 Tax=Thiopseudomonas denitrificans TaxID=1501432 RepID=A0A4R6TW29_9GAMM|nr:c-type cytochrome [Thiopseudomonas denitrificans]TDQ35476.1 cytochrome c553 [Thiopseudomonas denitrificans]
MNKLVVSLLLSLGITGLAHAAGDAEAGKNKILMCQACHGADGNTTLMPTYPKLGGQGANYLFKQMLDIKTGERPVVEMTGMLDAMSDQDMKDIAAWYASQKGTTGYADPELAERGEALFRGGKLADGMPACSGCHSPDGAGLDLARYPKLSGQHADYIAKQLTDFREGDRYNDGDAMTMRDVAEKLSNKDIKALASYIQGLH